MAELDTIDVELKDLKIVKSVFARHLPYKQVWAYGSRVKWTATETSDLDCVVFGATDSEIADAKEAFDESDIPFEVQLLNWETIPNDFKENIKEQYFVLQNKLDWKEDILGTVLKVKYGKDHKFLANGSIPVYGSGGVIRYVNDSIYNDESILIPRKGSLNNILYKNKPFWTVDTMFWSKIDKKMALPKFLYYQLTVIDYTSLNVGSTVPSLTVPVINQIKISLPPLPEQKAIASVLSSLDDKIDLLHRQNKTLESIAETLFRQWFIEEAQDDWEEGKLGDICNITGGYAFKSKDFIENGVPVVKIKNISNNRVDLIDKQFVSQDVALNVQQKFRLTNGDIVMAMTGATIGKIGLVNSFDYDFLLLNQRVAVIKGKYQALLWFLLNTINLEDDITNESNGAAQANISTNGIASVKIPKIYKKLAQEFNLVVEPIFDKILKNQKQIKTLESLRDTLLPKLISGNIRVKYEATA